MTRKVFETYTDAMLAARIADLTFKMDQARSMDATSAAKMYARLIGGVRREIIRRQKKSASLMKGTDR